MLNIEKNQPRHSYESNYRDVIINQETQSRVHNRIDSIELNPTQITELKTTKYGTEFKIYIADEAFLFTFLAM